MKHDIAWADISDYYIDPLHSDARFDFSRARAFKARRNGNTMSLREERQMRRTFGAIPERRRPLIFHFTLYRLRPLRALDIFAMRQHFLWRRRRPCAFPPARTRLPRRCTNYCMRRWSWRMMYHWPPAQRHMFSPLRPISAIYILNARVSIYAAYA